MRNYGKVTFIMIERNNKKELIKGYIVDNEYVIYFIDGKEIKITL